MTPTEPVQPVTATTYFVTELRDGVATGQRQEWDGRDNAILMAAMFNQHAGKAPGLSYRAEDADGNPLVAGICVPPAVAEPHQELPAPMKPRCEARTVADRIAEVLEDYRRTDDDEDFSTPVAIDEVMGLLLNVERLARAADPDAWESLAKPGMGQHTARLRTVQLAARRQVAIEHAERIAAHLQELAVPRD